ncbi:MAG: RDD family protein, partial [Nitrospiria bacterium]
MEIIDPVSGRADPRPIEENTPLEPQEGKTASAAPPADREITLIPAGFLRRAVAFLIDLFIVQGLYLILMVVGVMGIRFSTGGGRGFFLSGEVPPSMSAPFITGWFFLFVGYFTFFHSYNGQTPAKMI